MAEQQAIQEAVTSSSLNSTLSSKNHSKNTQPTTTSQNTTNTNAPSITQNSQSLTNASSSPRHTTQQQLLLTTSEHDSYTAAGVLPEFFMDMRQKMEAMTLFDSEMLQWYETTNPGEDNDDNNDPNHNTTTGGPVHYYDEEARQALKRSSQQSISASILMGLAHKKYERRRLAAMEMEKIVRGLIHSATAATADPLQQQQYWERIRAILLLLSDDYVRSTNEDARKGGVVGLAACAIALKHQDKNSTNTLLQECQDLILASVVHACQDHSQRVRYYATESLFNVVKVVPHLAVQHFFILFEILRSLYADVNLDVRTTGAEMLDRKLKQVIVTAMNQGEWTASECVPIFARFVHIHNKSTNRLTLTWLQELNEKVEGSPILEFLHLFLGGIFHMVADSTVLIRQSALAFLQSVLPKLLNHDNSGQNKIDYDKILQALVTSMEHPDPFVRKVAVYWMSRIVQVHMKEEDKTNESTQVTRHQPGKTTLAGSGEGDERKDAETVSSATESVRNSLPHVLPGILLSIGDEETHLQNMKSGFLPDQTTADLAEETNKCLQDAVRKDGQSYVHHLDGFIVTLREELDSLGGSGARRQTAVDRSPFRSDVKKDGTGIERPGWFRSSSGAKQNTESSMIRSRLCALDWIVVLYDHVVPLLLKADYAREFVFAIINQLLDHPPKAIVSKSIEVLAKITIPDPGEDASRSKISRSPAKLPISARRGGDDLMSNDSIPETIFTSALEVIEPERKALVSRNREVFAAVIRLHAHNVELLSDLASFVTHMCKLQPPEFIFMSFAVEIDRYVLEQQKEQESQGTGAAELQAKSLKYVSAFVQHLSFVLLNADETRALRDVLRDCIGSRSPSEQDRKRAMVFQILLHAFAHNYPAAVSLCFFAGAYKTISLSLNALDPLEIDLNFLLEVDRLVEMLERPLFRHLPIRMLQGEQNPDREGSGSMLFQSLRKLVMVLPQSSCYSILKDRVVSVSRYRMSALSQPFASKTKKSKLIPSDTEGFVKRIRHVRSLHTSVRWELIRAVSLEIRQKMVEESPGTEGDDRRDWLGYESKEEELEGRQMYRNERDGVAREGPKVEEIKAGYNAFNETSMTNVAGLQVVDNGDNQEDEDETWKKYWVGTN